MSWLPGQEAFLRDSEPVKLFRAGNQALGKTTVGLSEVHFHCRGDHPYQQVKEPPVEWWVLCGTWSQSLAIQQKFYDIAHSDLSNADNFSPINGFHANKPAGVYKNGSVVRFKTTNQGGLALAGATLDGALFDEPPSSPRIFEEVRKRLMRRQGRLLMTLTPINAPVDWLREMCEAGQISDHHHRLEPAELIPVGEDEPLCLPDGTPMDEAWIAEIVASTLAYEAPVVCHGEWECRVEGRMFRAFSDLEHVTPKRPEGEVELFVGFDHGTKVGKECAVLVACDREGDHDRVWVLDEYVAGDNTSTRDDAIAVLNMLRRQNVTWKQLDKAWGDRLYVRGAETKTNRELMEAMARVLSVPVRSLIPPIRTVKRGKGRNKWSVSAGCRYLHQAMVRPGHFHIAPRCENLIKSLNEWDGRDDDHKDKVDALRYALQDAVFNSTRARRRSARVYMY